MTENTSHYGIEFCGLLTIAFIVLKLTKVIAWSWWWVLAPVWVPAGAIVICGVVLGIAKIKISEK